jgi:hypothetical protein
MEFTAELIEPITCAILKELGRPQSEFEGLALIAFEVRDYQRVDILAACDLGNHYCRSLAYLGSAQKLFPGTAKILAEAARAAADLGDSPAERAETLDILSGVITEAFAPVLQSIKAELATAGGLR